MVRLHFSVEEFPKEVTPAVLGPTSKIAALARRSPEVRAVINSLTARIAGGTIRLAKPAPTSEESKRFFSQELGNLASKILTQFVLFGMCVVVLPHDGSMAVIRGLEEFKIEQGFDAYSRPIYKIQLAEGKNKLKAHLAVLVHTEPESDHTLNSSLTSLVSEYAVLRMMRLAHLRGFVRRQLAPLGLRATKPEADGVLPKVISASELGIESGQGVAAELVQQREREGPRRVNAGVRNYFALLDRTSELALDFKDEADAVAKFASHGAFVPEAIFDQTDAPIPLPMPPLAPELNDHIRNFQFAVSMAFGLPSQLWNPANMSEAVSNSVNDSATFHTMFLAKAIREALELLLRQYAMSELLGMTHETVPEETAASSPSPPVEGGYEILEEHKYGVLEERPAGQLDDESDKEEGANDRKRKSVMKEQVVVELIPQLPMSTALALRESEELSDQGFQQIMHAQLGLEPKNLVGQKEKVDNQVKLESVDIQQKKLKIDAAVAKQKASSNGGSE